MDLSYATGRANNPTDDEEDHVLDLTNFDGEDDTRVPGEMQLSLRVKKEGRLRRAKSRKVQAAALAKADLNMKAAARGGGDGGEMVGGVRIVNDGSRATPAKVSLPQVS